MWIEEDAVTSPYQHPYPYPPQQIVHAKAPSGTPGIVALCLGVPSLLAALFIPILFWWVPLLPSAVAVIIGVIGRGRQYVNRTMSLWGAICGTVALLCCFYGAYALDQAVDEFNREMEQIERELATY